MRIHVIFSRTPQISWPLFRLLASLFDDDEFARLKYKSQALALEVNMHEVIGHASGQMAPHLDINSEDVTKEYYSALEEGRADLVALWFLGDTKLVDLGLVEPDDLKALSCCEP